MFFQLGHCPYSTTLSMLPEHGLPLIVPFTARWSPSTSVGEGTWVSWCRHPQMEELVKSPPSRSRNDLPFHRFFEMIPSLTMSIYWGMKNTKGRQLIQWLYEWWWMEILGFSVDFSWELQEKWWKVSESWSITRVKIGTWCMNWPPGARRMVDPESMWINGSLWRWSFFPFYPTVVGLSEGYIFSTCDKHDELQHGWVKRGRTFQNHGHLMAKSYYTSTLW